MIAMGEQGWTRRDCLLGAGAAVAEIVSTAQECGFASAGAMRQVFRRVLAVRPAQYREHFRSARSASL